MDDLISELQWEHGGRHGSTPPGPGTLCLILIPDKPQTRPEGMTPRREVTPLLGEYMPVSGMWVVRGYAREYVSHAVVLAWTPFEGTVDNIAKRLGVE